MSRYLDHCIEQAALTSDDALELAIINKPKKVRRRCKSCGESIDKHTAGRTLCGWCRLIPYYYERGER